MLATEVKSALLQNRSWCGVRHVIRSGVTFRLGGPVNSQAQRPLARNLRGNLFLSRQQQAGACRSVNTHRHRGFPIEYSVIAEREAIRTETSIVGHIQRLQTYDCSPKLFPELSSMASNSKVRPATMSCGSNAEPNKAS